MNLFQNKKFIGASGKELDYKIECDALTQEDLECIAANSVKHLPKFGKVLGVPTGGLPLQRAFEPYITEGSNVVLIVDDVWTTGGSMKKFIMKYTLEESVMGFVIFARSELPDWVKCFARVSF